MRIRIPLGVSVVVALAAAAVAAGGAAAKAGAVRDRAGGEDALLSSSLSTSARSRRCTRLPR